MFLSTHGAFGRQARFRHGGTPVVGTLHPAGRDFLQLPSQSHINNFLQYVFSSGVLGVVADRQLPVWVGAYVPRPAKSGVLLVQTRAGAQVIVRMQDRDHYPPVFKQLGPHLWLVERSRREVDAPVVLNDNLAETAQTLKSHRDEQCALEERCVISALQICRVTTSRSLTGHVQMTLRARPECVPVVLGRLLLNHRVSIDLVARLWGPQTLLMWGKAGTGFAAPIPAAALGFREAA